MKSYSDKKYNYFSGPVCHETHKPLPLKEFVVFGGSCIQPSVTNNMDIYIGFDRGIKVQEGLYPWDQKVSFYYPIKDGSVPRSLEVFKSFLDWVISNLKQGKKIHMGCVGGHGRTGLVFSALVKTYLDIEDATTYVRENYCKKAVETEEQVNWLFTHFGIKKVTPYHETKYGFKAYKNKQIDDYLPIFDTGETLKTDGGLTYPSNYGSIWKKYI